MIQVVVPTSISVTDDTTTITLPVEFTPAAGQVYDIPLSAAIPDGTNGTIITITNDTISGNLLNRVGNNVRMGTLNAQWILRVRFFNDPAHYNLIGRFWRQLV